MNGWLVNHGRAAFLEPFIAPASLGPLERGTEVVVRSRRGIEWGTILCATDSSTDGTIRSILRCLTEADRRLLVEHRRCEAELLHVGQTGIAEHKLPMLLLDAEVLLEGDVAILEAVHWQACNATPLLEMLSRRFGLRVLLHDVSTPQAVKSNGCGKAGCGSSGGGCSSCGSGCSSGSCSRGAVKSAEELTSYFAGLRSQMEAQAARIRLN